jgi:polyisoprenoid-binding protein YceI
VALEGTFDKWDATVAFTSPDVTTGVLNVKISGGQCEHRKWHEGRQVEEQTNSSDVKENPLITFVSKKFVADRFRHH